MPDLKRALVAAGLFALGLLVVGLFFASALFILAIAAPVVALLIASVRLRAAATLWQSHGRLPLPDGAVRIVEPARTKGLAVSELVASLGTLSAGLVPTAAMFVSFGWAVVAALVALGAFAAARRMRTRLFVDGSSVDVLPPE